MVSRMAKESHIRSYVRREHRITPGQERALEEYWPKYGLDIQTGFWECPKECILEIGFGMGHSLLAMAEKFPEKMFIGVEVHRPGIGALFAAATKRGVNNIKVYCEDCLYVLKQSIKDESLSQIQIFFPDPWPKNRHHKRRLVQPEFTALLLQKLKPNGYLHLATDWQDYAQQMLQIIESVPGFKNEAGKGQFLSHRNDRPLTKFETRGIKLNHKIWDLLFSKTRAIHET